MENTKYYKDKLLLIKLSKTERKLVEALIDGAYLQGQADQSDKGLEIIERVYGK